MEDRPTEGQIPPPGTWYEKGIYYGENSTLNKWFYGVHLEHSLPQTRWGSGRKGVRVRGGGGAILIEERFSWGEEGSFSCLCVKKNKRNRENRETSFFFLAV